MEIYKTASILGCGWLGLPVAKQLIENGYKVKGSTTRQERVVELESAGVKAYVLKAERGLWNEESLKDFLSSDVLIIAIPPGTKKNPESTHAIEITHILQYIQQHSISIQKIIYISSTSVYKNENRLVVEADIQEEDDAENKILAHAEKAIQESGIKQRIVLRMGGLTGYDRMLARFFAGKVDLKGWNEPVNLVHRDDAVGCILFVLEKEIEEEVLNVCSPEHPSRKDFYTTLCANKGLQQPLFDINTLANWKEVSSEKISSLGYVWKYPDPFNYTYN